MVAYITFSFINAGLDFKEENEENIPIYYNLQNVRTIDSGKIQILIERKENRAKKLVF